MISQEQDQVTDEKVTALKQDLEDSERRIRNLTKSFHMYFEMKGEPDSANTIVLVNKHLSRRTCCRFLRSDLQVAGCVVRISSFIYYAMSLCY